MKLMKEEVLREMEAVKCFIDLAIQAQKAGYTKAATFFIGQAQEDCTHAFAYAKELDKHNALDGDMSITEIVKKFYDLEAGAITRLTAIYNEASSGKHMGSLPFIFENIEEHSAEAYKAKKLLQNVTILDQDRAIKDIEDLFEELSD